MSNYTPDEEQVREQPPQIGTVAEKHAEFDRFIARVKAGALREASDEYAASDRAQTPGVVSVLTFMHYLAGRIENEAGL